MIKMNQKMLQIKQKSDADYFELVKEKLDEFIEEIKEEYIV